VDHRGVGAAELELDRQRVRCGDAVLREVPLRRTRALRPDVALEVPGDGLGVQRRAVGELQTLAQLDREGLAVLADLIALRLVRHHAGVGAVRLRRQQEQTAVDGLHLRDVGAAGGVGRRVETGGVRTREGLVLEDRDAAAALRLSGVAAVRVG
jgi:hypothetical protein